MIAHHGYQDGSGTYFISIDTDRCAKCPGGECVPACPAKILERIEDDYGDTVAAVRESARNRVKYACAPCKPVGATALPPCIAACPHQGMKHSWQ